MRTFVDHLRDSHPLVCAELRPPRSDLDDGASMDSWFAIGSAVRRVAAEGRVVFLTDNATGSPEEESLHHLVANLGESVPRDRLCPFLTTKHELEYCLWFAARAVEGGFPALVVLGGDRTVGPPRCLPHGADLRRRIRDRFPGLPIGGWVNPRADPERQLDYVTVPDNPADFLLAQIATHYEPGPVARLTAAMERRGAPPAVFGVFFWRSANRKTLEFLSRFLPVPIEELTRDFEAGLPPEEICARTIRGLREVGVRHVYVSNLDVDRAPEILADVESRL